MKIYQKALAAYLIIYSFRFSDSHLCSVSPPIDLWILIDGSSTIGGHFHNELLLGASIIATLPPGSRVTGIQFASWTKAHFSMRKPEEAELEFLSVKPIGGSAQLGYGLLYTKRYEMGESTRNRQAISDYVLVITGSNSIDDPYLPAQDIRRTHNATTICVGVMENTNDVQLLEIAGDPRQLITVPKFEDLGDMWLLETILHKLCKGSSELAKIRLNDKSQIYFCNGVEECAFKDNNKEVHNLCTCWNDRVGTVCSERHPYIRRGYRCHKPQSQNTLPSIEKCADKDTPQCISWASVGQCTKNHEIMSIDCPHTCGFCDLRACRGLERCADQSSGITKASCLCQDPLIGNICSQFHPWGGAAYRCHYPTQASAEITIVEAKETEENETISIPHLIPTDDKLADNDIANKKSSL